MLDMIGCGFRMKIQLCRASFVVGEDNKINVGAIKKKGGSRN
jgi:hypothetical protein